MSVTKTDRNSLSLGDTPEASTNGFAPQPGQQTPVGDFSLTVSSQDAARALANPSLDSTTPYRRMSETSATYAIGAEDRHLPAGVVFHTDPVQVSKAKLLARLSPDRQADVVFTGGGFTITARFSYLDDKFTTFLPYPIESPDGAATLVATVNPPINSRVYFSTRNSDIFAAQEWLDATKPTNFHIHIGHQRGDLYALQTTTKIFPGVRVGNGPVGLLTDEGRENFKFNLDQERHARAEINRYWLGPADYQFRMIHDEVDPKDGDRTVETSDIIVETPYIGVHYPDGTEIAFEAFRWSDGTFHFRDMEGKTFEPGEDSNSLMVYFRENPTAEFVDGSAKAQIQTFGIYQVLSASGIPGVWVLDQTDGTLWPSEVDLKTWPAITKPKKDRKPARTEADVVRDLDREKSRRVAPESLKWAANASAERAAAPAASVPISPVDAAVDGRDAQTPELTAAAHTPPPIAPVAATAALTFPPNLDLLADPTDWSLASLQGRMNPETPVPVQMRSGDYVVTLFVKYAVNATSAQLDFDTPNVVVQTPNGTIRDARIVRGEKRFPMIVDANGRELLSVAIAPDNMAVEEMVAQQGRIESSSFVLVLTSTPWEEMPQVLRRIAPIAQTYFQQGVNGILAVSNEIPSKPLPQLQLNNLAKASASQTTFWQGIDYGIGQTYFLLRRNGGDFAFVTRQEGQKTYVKLGVTRMGQTVEMEYEALVTKHGRYSLLQIDELGRDFLLDARMGNLLTTSKPHFSNFRDIKARGYGLFQTLLRLPADASWTPVHAVTAWHAANPEPVATSTGTTTDAVSGSGAITGNGGLSGGGSDGVGGSGGARGPGGPDGPSGPGDAAGPTPVESAVAAAFMDPDQVRANFPDGVITLMADANLYGIASLAMRDGDIVRGTFRQGDYAISFWQTQSQGMREIVTGADNVVIRTPAGEITNARIVLEARGKFAIVHEETSLRLRLTHLSDAEGNKPPVVIAYENPELENRPAIARVRALANRAINAFQFTDGAALLPVHLRRPLPAIPRDGEISQIELIYDGFSLIFDVCFNEQRQEWMLGPQSACTEVVTQNFVMGIRFDGMTEVRYLTFSADFIDQNGVRKVCINKLDQSNVTKINRAIGGFLFEPKSGKTAPLAFPRNAKRSHLATVLFDRAYVFVENSTSLVVAGADDAGGPDGSDASDALGANAAIAAPTAGELAVAAAFMHPENDTATFPNGRLLLSPEPNESVLKLIRDNFNQTVTIPMVYSQGGYSVVCTMILDEDDQIIADPDAPVLIRSPQGVITNAHWSGDNEIVHDATGLHLAIYDQTIGTPPKKIMFLSLRTSARGPIDGDYTQTSESLATRTVNEFEFTSADGTRLPIPIGRPLPSDPADGDEAEIQLRYSMFGLRFPVTYNASQERWDLVLKDMAMPRFANESKTVSVALDLYSEFQNDAVHGWLNCDILRTSDGIYVITLKNGDAILYNPKLGKMAPLSREHIAELGAGGFGDYLSAREYIYTAVLEPLSEPVADVADLSVSADAADNTVDDKAEAATILPSVTSTEEEHAVALDFMYPENDLSTFPDGELLLIRDYIDGQIQKVARFLQPQSSAIVYNRGAYSVVIEGGFLVAGATVVIRSPHGEIRNAILQEIDGGLVVVHAATGLSLELYQRTETGIKFLLLEQAQDKTAEGTDYISAAQRQSIQNFEFVQDQRLEPVVQGQKLPASPRDQQRSELQIVYPSYRVLFPLGYNQKNEVWNLMNGDLQIPTSANGPTNVDVGFLFAGEAVAQRGAYRCDLLTTKDNMVIITLKPNVSFLFDPKSGRGVPISDERLQALKASREKDPFRNYVRSIRRYVYADEAKVVAGAAADEAGGPDGPDSPDGVGSVDAVASAEERAVADALMHPENDTTNFPNGYVAMLPDISRNTIVEIAKGLDASVMATAVYQQGEYTVVVNHNEDDIEIRGPQGILRHAHIVTESTAEGVHKILVHEATGLRLSFYRENQSNYLMITTDFGYTPSEVDIMASLEAAVTAKQNAVNDFNDFTNGTTLLPVRVAERLPAAPVNGQEAVVEVLYDDFSVLFPLVYNAAHARWDLRLDGKTLEQIPVDKGINMMPMTFRVRLTRGEQVVQGAYSASLGRTLDGKIIIELDEHLAIFIFDPQKGKIVTLPIEKATALGKRPANEKPFRQYVRDRQVVYGERPAVVEAVAPPKLAAVPETVDGTDDAVPTRTDEPLPPSGVLTTLVAPPEVEASTPATPLLLPNVILAPETESFIMARLRSRLHPGERFQFQLVTADNSVSFVADLWFDATRNDFRMSVADAHFLTANANSYPAQIQDTATPNIFEVQDPLAPSVHYSLVLRPGNHSTPILFSQDTPHTDEEKMSRAALAHGLQAAHTQNIFRRRSNLQQLDVPLVGSAPANPTVGQVWVRSIRLTDNFDMGLSLVYRGAAQGWGFQIDRKSGAVQAVNVAIQTREYIDAGPLSCRVLVDANGIMVLEVPFLQTRYILDTATGNLVPTDTDRNVKSNPNKAASDFRSVMRGMQIVTVPPMELAAAPAMVPTVVSAQDDVGPDLSVTGPIGASGLAALLLPPVDEGVEQVAGPAAVLPVEPITLTQLPAPAVLVADTATYQRRIFLASLTPGESVWIPFAGDGVTLEVPVVAGWYNNTYSLGPPRQPTEVRTPAGMRPVSVLRQNDIPLENPGEVMVFRETLPDSTQVRVYTGFLAGRGGMIQTQANNQPMGDKSFPVSDRMPIEEAVRAWPAAQHDYWFGTAETVFTATRSDSWTGYVNPADGSVLEFRLNTERGYDFDRGRGIGPEVGGIIPRAVFCRYREAGSTAFVSGYRNIRFLEPQLKNFRIVEFPGIGLRVAFDQSDGSVWPTQVDLKTSKDRTVAQIEDDLRSEKAKRLQGNSIPPRADFYTPEQVAAWQTEAQEALQADERLGQAPQRMQNPLGGELANTPRPHTGTMPEFQRWMRDLMGTRFANQPDAEISEGLEFYPDLTTWWDEQIALTFAQPTLGRSTPIPTTLTLHAEDPQTGGFYRLTVPVVRRPDGKVIPNFNGDSGTVMLRTPTGQDIRCPIACFQPSPGDDEFYYIQFPGDSSLRSIVFAPIIAALKVQGNRGTVDYSQPCYQMTIARRDRLFAPQLLEQDQHTYGLTRTLFAQSDFSEVAGQTYWEGVRLISGRELAVAWELKDGAAEFQTAKRNGKVVVRTRYRLSRDAAWQEGWMPGRVVRDGNYTFVYNELLDTCLAFSDTLRAFYHLPYVTNQRDWTESALESQLAAGMHQIVFAGNTPQRALATRAPESAAPPPPPASPVNPVAAIAPAVREGLPPGLFLRTDPVELSKAKLLAMMTGLPVELVFRSGDWEVRGLFDYNAERDEFNNFSSAPRRLTTVPPILHVLDLEPMGQLRTTRDSRRITNFLVSEYLDGSMRRCYMHLGKLSSQQYVVVTTNVVGDKDDTSVDKERAKWTSGQPKRWQSYDIGADDKRRAQMAQRDYWYANGDVARMQSTAGANPAVCWQGVMLPDGASFEMELGQSASGLYDLVYRGPQELPTQRQARPVAVRFREDSSREFAIGEIDGFFIRMVGNYGFMRLPVLGNTICVINLENGLFWFTRVNSNVWDAVKRGPNQKAARTDVDIIRELKAEEAKLGMPAAQLATTAVVDEPVPSAEVSSLDELPSEEVPPLDELPSADSVRPLLIVDEDEESAPSLPLAPADAAASADLIVDTEPETSDSTAATEMIVLGDGTTMPVAVAWIRLDDLDLSIRSANAMEQNGIEYLWQFLQCSEELLLSPQFKSFGRKSLREMQEIVQYIGARNGGIVLQLGTVFPSSVTNRLLHDRTEKEQLQSFDVIPNRARIPIGRSWMGPRSRIHSIRLSKDVAYYPVDDLDLSVRSANGLRASGIEYIWQLLEKTDGELLKIRRFGRKSLYEVIEVLWDFGDERHLVLGLGMKVTIVDESTESAGAEPHGGTIDDGVVDDATADDGQSAELSEASPQMPAELAALSPPDPVPVQAAAPGFPSPSHAAENPIPWNELRWTRPQDMERALIIASVTGQPSDVIFQGGAADSNVELSVPLSWDRVHDVYAPLHLGVRVDGVERYTNTLAATPAGTIVDPTTNIDYSAFIYSATDAATGALFPMMAMPTGMVLFTQPSLESNDNYFGEILTAWQRYTNDFYLARQDLFRDAREDNNAYVLGDLLSLEATSRNPDEEPFEELFVQYAGDARIGLTVIYDEATVRWQFADRSAIRDGVWGTDGVLIEGSYRATADGQTVAANWPMQEAGQVGDWQLLYWPMYHTVYALNTRDKRIMVLPEKPFPDMGGWNDAARLDREYARRLQVRVPQAHEENSDIPPPAQPSSADELAVTTTAVTIRDPAQELAQIVGGNRETESVTVIGNNRARDLRTDQPIQSFAFAVQVGQASFAFELARRQDGIWYAQAGIIGDNKQTKRTEYNGDFNVITFDGTDFVIVLHRFSGLFITTTAADLQVRSPQDLFTARAIEVNGLALKPAGQMPPSRFDVANALNLLPEMATIAQPERPGLVAVTNLPLTDTAATRVAEARRLGGLEFAFMGRDATGRYVYGTGAPIAGGFGRQIQLHIPEDISGLSTRMRECEIYLNGRPYSMGIDVFNYRVLRVRLYTRGAQSDRGGQIQGLVLYFDPNTNSFVNVSKPEEFESWMVTKWMASKVNWTASKKELPILSSVRAETRYLGEGQLPEVLHGHEMTPAQYRDRLLELRNMGYQYVAIDFLAGRRQVWSGTASMNHTTPTPGASVSMSEHLLSLDANLPVEARVEGWSAADYVAPANVTDWPIAPLRPQVANAENQFWLRTPNADQDVFAEQRDVRHRVWRFEMGHRLADGSAALQILVGEALYASARGATFVEYRARLLAYGREYELLAVEEYGEVTFSLPQPNQNIRFSYDAESSTFTARRRFPGRPGADPDMLRGYQREAQQSNTLETYRQGLWLAQQGFFPSFWDWHQRNEYEIGFRNDLPEAEWIRVRDFLRLDFTQLCQDALARGETVVAFPFRVGNTVEWRDLSIVPSDAVVVAGPVAAAPPPPPAEPPASRPTTSRPVVSVQLMSQVAPLNKRQTDTLRSRRERGAIELEWLGRDASGRLVYGAGGWIDGGRGRQIQLHLDLQNDVVSNSVIYVNGQVMETHNAVTDGVQRVFSTAGYAQAGSVFNFWFDPKTNSFVNIEPVANFESWLLSRNELPILAMSRAAQMERYGFSSTRIAEAEAQGYLYGISQELDGERRQGFKVQAPQAVVLTSLPLVMLPNRMSLRPAARVVGLNGPASTATKTPPWPVAMIFDPNDTNPFLQPVPQEAQDLFPEQANVPHRVLRFESTQRLADGSAALEIWVGEALRPIVAEKPLIVNGVKHALEYRARMRLYGRDIELNARVVVEASGVCIQFSVPGHDEALLTFMPEQGGFLAQNSPNYNAVISSSEIEKQEVYAFGLWLMAQGDVPIFWGQTQRATYRNDLLYASGLNPSTNQGGNRRRVQSFFDADLTELCAQALGRGESTIEFPFREGGTIVWRSLRIPPIAVQTVERADPAVSELAMPDETVNVKTEPATSERTRSEVGTIPEGLSEAVQVALRQDGVFTSVTMTDGYSVRVGSARSTTEFTLNLPILFEGRWMVNIVTARPVLNRVVVGEQTFGDLTFRVNVRADLSDGRLFEICEYPALGIRYVLDTVSGLGYFAIMTAGESPNYAEEFARQTLQVEGRTVQGPQRQLSGNFTLQNYTSVIRQQQAIGSAVRAAWDASAQRRYDVSYDAANGRLAMGLNGAFAYTVGLSPEHFLSVLGQTGLANIWFINARGVEQRVASGVDSRTRFYGGENFTISTLRGCDVRVVIHQRTGLAILTPREIGQSSLDAFVQAFIAAEIVMNGRVVKAAGAMPPADFTVERPILPMPNRLDAARLSIATNISPKRALEFSIEDPGAGARRAISLDVGFEVNGANIVMIVREVMPLDEEVDVSNPRVFRYVVRSNGIISVYHNNVQFDYQLDFSPETRAITHVWVSSTSTNTAARVDGGRVVLSDSGAAAVVASRSGGGTPNMEEDAYMGEDDDLPLSEPRVRLADLLWDDVVPVGNPDGVNATHLEVDLQNMGDDTEEVVVVRVGVGDWMQQERFARQANRGVLLLHDIDDLDVTAAELLQVAETQRRNVAVARGVEPTAVVFRRGDKLFERSDVSSLAANLAVLPDEQMRRLYLSVVGVQMDVDLVNEVLQSHNSTLYMQMLRAGIMPRGDLGAWFLEMLERDPEAVREMNVRLNAEGVDLVSEPEALVYELLAFEVAQQTQSRVFIDAKVRAEFAQELQTVQMREGVMLPQGTEAFRLELVAREEVKRAEEAKRRERLREWEGRK